MKCRGCGVTLQNLEKNAVGFTPKLDVDYCQRCYRIKHYDDLTISLKQGIDVKEVIEKINHLDALMVWVVDLFDFEANMLKHFNDYLQGKDIIFVGTKRDLLPYTLSNEKLTNFILERLAKYKISVKAIVVTGELHFSLKQYNDSIEILDNVIEHYRNGKDVCVVGMANAGKSSLLNQLLQLNTLTTSRYPGTTIDLVKVAYKDYFIYDSPGISKQDTILTHIDELLLKQIVPIRCVHPTVFQLSKNQTISIAGLVKVDLIGCEDVSAVAYFKNELLIHRGKYENSQQLWENQLNTLLTPSLNQSIHEMKEKVFHLKSNLKTDIVIHGLGWICVSGKTEKIVVTIHENIGVSLREGMI